MIPAEPSRLARRAGARYFRYRGRRRLAGVHAAELERMEAWNRNGSNQAADRPLIIVANHASWWDALMPILISLDHFDHDAYGVMEERQLRRFGFFRKLGMFSIDRAVKTSGGRPLLMAASSAGWPKASHPNGWKTL